MTILGDHKAAHFVRQGGGGGTPYMTGVGMLFVSLRGINFGFWSRLGCYGQTPLYLAVKVSFRVALEEILKNYNFQFLLFTRFM